MNYRAILEHNVPTNESKINAEQTINGIALTIAP